MPLTTLKIKNSPPKRKPYKIYDSQGLYLLVNRKGKYFRFNYKLNGKYKTLALGVFPETSLKEARLKRDEARILLSKGVDPSEHKKALKKSIYGPDTFEAVAREWFEKKVNSWTPGYSRTVIARLEQNIFPWIGHKQISEVSAAELLEALRRIEARGAIETAHRVKQICGQIFRYAIATSRAERDPAADLKGALTSYKPKRMACITDPRRVGELMRAIDEYKGHFISKCALKIIPYVFVRHAELRYAEWSELDFDKKEWRIPAEKMKIKRPHIVPLSRQVIEILNEIKPLTGNGKFIFPSLYKKERPLSENTLLVALRRLGYSKEEMCVHGFRSVASTLLHENGWPSELIERQLAHLEGNQVKAAYNYADYLPERHKMMQWWADYLDALKENRSIKRPKFLSLFS